MTRDQRSMLIDTLCLLAIFLWLAIYSQPYFFASLAGNSREIQTYNLDSMVMMKGVEDAFAAPWFHMNFNDYGHFYFNLALGIGYVYSQFHPLTEHVLFLILRLLSLLGGYCSIIITFLFARRYLGQVEAAFAACVVAFSPRFIEYSNEVKPDTWQVFFLTLSLYFLARAFEKSDKDSQINARLRARFGFVLASSAAAGAAFGTKYQGILLVPLLAIAACLVPITAISDKTVFRSVRVFALFAVLAGIGLAAIGHIEYPQHFLLVLMLDDIAYLRSGPFYWAIQAGRLACYMGSAVCFAVAIAYALEFDFNRWRNFVKKILIFSATVMAFVMAFAVTSPWLLYRMQFLRQLYLRSAIAGGGDWFGFRWIEMLFGYAGYEQLFINYGIGAMAIIGAAFILSAAARRYLRFRQLPFLFVLVFSGIFLGLLVAKINFVSTLYLLPLIPHLALLAAFSLHEMRMVLMRWLAPSRASIAIFGLAVLLVFAQIGQGGAQLLQYPMLVTSMTSQNRMLGDWLIRCVPPRTRMLAAAYSYAPPSIENVVVSMGGDYGYYEIANPDVVTIDLKDAAGVLGIEKQNADTPGHTPSSAARYYQMILGSGAWRAGPVFGPFQVYVKAQGTVLNPACR